MMAFSQVFVTLFFYLAVLIFFVGTIFKMVQYWRTPNPLKIPLAPVPMTRNAVFLRLFKEVVLFRSLFNANLPTWFFSWLFHLGLLLVFIHHLRFFYGNEPADFFLWIAPLKYAGFLMLIGLSGLLLRRIFIDRLRFISAPSDYLWLFLLLYLTLNGLMMSVFNVGNVSELVVADFIIDSLMLTWPAVPQQWIFMGHLFAASLLFLLFPMSKLLHAPGIFFSPTLTQKGDARQKRHHASAPNE